MPPGQRIPHQAAVAAGVLGALALALFTPLPAKSVDWIGASLPVETRHQIVAVASGLVSPPIETADFTPMQHTGVNPVGANTFLEQEVEEEKRRRTLAMLRDAGVGWIRQQFPWQEIEPDEKGRFWDAKHGISSWAKYDNIVALAEEYDIEIIARLDTSPQWARPGNSWHATPPDNLEDFGDFVYEVVRRYRGRIRYYQIWNEPNLHIEWGLRPVDPRGFVELLKVAARRAREADPQAVILAPALAPTIEMSDRAMNDLHFLQAMYDAGAAPYFDILSVQAYGLRHGPDDRRLDLDDVNFSRPLLIREIMVQNGDAHKPIWATEIGWNALPPDFPEPPIYGRVSEELQARYTVRAFQRALEEWPWMGVMAIWFFKRADDRERNQQMYYFRMVDPDFTPRPLYDAIKETADQRRRVYPGFFQENHWALTYEGAWETVQGPDVRYRAARAAAPGQSVHFSFVGTHLEIAAKRGPGAGALSVTVDSQPANRLPKDARGQAILDLAGPGEGPSEPVLVAVVGDGVHTVHLTTMPSPSGGGAEVVLDGIVVRRIPGPPVGALAASLLAVLLLVTRWQPSEVEGRPASAGRGTSP
ncbi:MAG TPA: hypothetical protein VIN09_00175 [Chloroflexota bacterium]